MDGHMFEVECEVICTVCESELDFNVQANTIVVDPCRLCLAMSEDNRDD